MSDLTPAEIAAAKYLLTYEDLPDDLWPPLPEGVTAEHVMAARKRHETRRMENRRAIDAAPELKVALPLPKMGPRPDLLDQVMGDLSKKAAEKYGPHGPRSTEPKVDAVVARRGCTVLVVAAIVFSVPWFVGAWVIARWLVGAP